MKSHRLREEWKAIPNRGILENGTEERMWNNIRTATLHKYRILYRWTTAACVLFFITVSSYLFYNQINSTKIEITSIMTYANDIRLLTLPDSTRVWLNQNSEIYYPSGFSKNERTITLKGEAFFEVKRDPKRPFVIRSGSIKTTVLGTSFNIKAYDNKDPQVNVRTGKVKVETQQNSVFIERGCKAVYEQKTSMVKKQKSNVFEPEWKKVLIYADGLTLEEVLTKLKTDHNFKISYLQDDLKNLKIQGTLDTRQGFDEMLQTIAFALEIQIKPTGNHSYLISR